MKISKVTCFPVNGASLKVKANGVVEFEEALELKYILMQGPQDLFVSWSGGKAYTKKDGTKGWDSPIFIKDKATQELITKEIVSKYKSVSGGKGGASSSAAEYNDASYAADDIPF